VPEGMNVEVAHKLSETEHRPPGDHRGWREASEIVEVILLAIVAVATAWSGYQAARWDGKQAFLYGTASRERIEADASLTLGGQQKLLDVTTFNTWIVESRFGKDQVADLYVRRFSPEFRVAFDAWLKTDPFTDPTAPPGPSFMPEYRNSLVEEGQQLNEAASVSFEEGTQARETADRYVRQTVLLATVLFLVAVAQRFTFRAVRVAAGVIAAILLLIALGGIATLPQG